MNRVITYIDGFNLYFGLKSKRWRRFYWLDPWKLSSGLLRDGQTLEAVRYFTARITPDASDPEKHLRQKTWLEAIGTLPKVTVEYGHYLVKTGSCRACGAKWPVPEEKMTDVNIAVAMMRDAWQDAFDTALLVSGDSDLAAPVITIREMLPTKRVVAVWPPDRQSARLREVATGFTSIGRDVLSNSQLPDEITKPDGFVLRRPDTWK